MQSGRFQNIQSCKASVVRVLGVVASIGVVQALKDQIGCAARLNVLAEQERGKGSKKIAHVVSITILI